MTRSLPYTTENDSHPDPRGASPSNPRNATLGPTDTSPRHKALSQHRTPRRIYMSDASRLFNDPHDTTGRIRTEWLTRPLARKGKYTKPLANAT